MIDRHVQGAFARNCSVPISVVRTTQIGTPVEWARKVVSLSGGASWETRREGPSSPCTFPSLRGRQGRQPIGLHFQSRPLNARFVCGELEPIPVVRTTKIGRPGEGTMAA